MKNIENHILDRLDQINDKVGKIETKLAFWKGSVAGISALISASIALMAKLF